jgi:hypothetical protein
MCANGDPLLLQIRCQSIPYLAAKCTELGVLPQELGDELGQVPILVR